MDANRRHHIFGDPRHNLAPLVRRCGSEEAAGQAIEDAVGAAVENGELAANEGEHYRQVFDVAGHSVTVIGRLVNGVPRVSTAWIPG
jgi:hypothetical protein